ncbi:kinase-like domain-containing protein [Phycomyces blakesleeanus]|uniref:Kinase-like domain-containing protein n=1 Tax=Phycomyces blakesleeanus TaxID=4837 RepID=A0ABR3AKI4_PHYBL
MITQFKRIFRHRKGHTDNSYGDTHGTTHDNMGANTAIHNQERDHGHIGTTTLRNVIRSRSTKERQKASERATQIIEQEKKRKQQTPQYPGLEKYEIIVKRGDGAFSNVYEAKEKRSGRSVAIKIAQKVGPKSSEKHGNTHLHPSMKRKPRATEHTNVLKEVQIMRSLRHTNIIQLIEFSESSEHYYLVLELCSGGELFNQIVYLTYFSEDLARHVIEQVAHAVRYMHEECGVVHRDIKPENILFDPIPFIPSDQSQLKHRPFDDPNKKDEGVFIKGVGGGGIGKVKLADFGLSKVIWDSSTMTPCGTVGYTAPEIVKDKKYSKSVDMWAIGCVLYTILCGFPPFYDESIRALTEKVSQGQFTFLSPWWDPISKSSKDLISHLLCVNPDDRYTIDQFLAHPWITGKRAQPPLPPKHKDPISVSLGAAKTTNDPRKLALHNATRKAAVMETISDPPVVDDEKITFQKQDDPHQYESNDTTNYIPGVESFDSDGRKEVFTPGAAALREILDITYAVQRMGEEKVNKNAAKKVWTDHNNDPTHPRHYSESDSGDEWCIESDEASPSESSSNTTIQTEIQVEPPKPRRKQFELNMSNATLLKNRNNHAKVAPI